MNNNRKAKLVFKDGDFYLCYLQYDDEMLSQLICSDGFIVARGRWNGDMSRTIIIHSNELSHIILYN